MVTWPHLAAGETRKCRLYHGQPYSQVKTGIPVTEEEGGDGRQAKATSSICHKQTWAFPHVDAFWLPLCKFTHRLIHRLQPLGICCSPCLETLLPFDHQCNSTFLLRPRSGFKSISAIPKLLFFSLNIFTWGAWVIQLVKRPTSAKLVSSSPTLGFLPSAQSPLWNLYSSLSLSLSAPPPLVCACACSLSIKN